MGTKPTYYVNAQAFARPFVLARLIVVFRAEAFDCEFPYLSRDTLVPFFHGLGHRV